METIDDMFKNNNPLYGSRNFSPHSQEGTVLQEFYRGAQVLVTGATGFMGKVLVEKLLRSCPNIERIFLLVRAKKGRSVEERIDDLVDSPCFSQLMLQSPKLKSKLVAIGGDIGAEGLGINNADRQLLRDVSVVFHLAATVRFDEELKIAINWNVRGSRDVLILCRSLSKLKSVIAVSTAYSNSPKETIKECIYDPPISSADALILVKCIDDDKMKNFTTSLLGKWPNTYSFSKALAEDVVKSYGQGLPVGIFRPAIVVSSMNEPMPGWTDTPFGPMGLCLGFTSGVIRTLHMDGDVVSNVVPCDMAINCLIATAWDVAKNRSLSEVPVYNYTVPKENGHTWGDGYKLQLKYSTRQPILKAMWYTSVVFTVNNHLITLYRALLHFLPALLLDFFLVMSFQKTRMVRMYKKIHKLDDAYVYFNSRSWHFEVKNVDTLWNMLSPSDKSMFHFDLRTIDWNTFHRNFWAGIRTFLAKESMDSIPAARIRNRKLYWLHRTTQLILASLCAYIIWVTIFAVIQVFI